MLVSTEKEVFELTYPKKESSFSKRIIAQFLEGEYCQIRIIGETKDGIWLICSPTKVPFDINQELIFIKDSKIQKKVALKSLLGEKDLDNTDAYYIIRDTVGDTIYFAISRISFPQRGAMKYFLLNTKTNEWEFLFQRKEALFSPLIIYKNKLYDLADDLTFDLPSFVNVTHGYSLRKLWIQVQNEEFVFFESNISISKGYYLVKKNVYTGEKNKIQVKRKYMYIGKNDSGIFIYHLNSPTALKVVFN